MSSGLFPLVREVTKILKYGAMAVRVIMPHTTIVLPESRVRICSMQFSHSAQSSKLQQTIILLCVVALFVPFVDKAYHIDDPVYIWVARQILRNPLDFFGFSANWYVEIQHGADISVSPPLYSYYLALIGSKFGWTEIPLHVASIVPAIAAALGTYRLAGCLKSNPFIAALTAVCTPVFLLCGSSVMVDMAMTAFYVWAIFFWITGLESDRGGMLRMAVAAILVVAAGLTKYFGLTLIPLLAVYPLWRREPARRWLPFLAAPVIVFAAYQYWTKQLYGFGHLTHASEYASSYKEWVHISIVKSLIDGLSFTGGGILMPIAFAPLLMTKRSLIPLSAGILVLALLIKALGMYSTPDSWLFFIQLVAFVTAGMYVLFAAGAGFLRDKDAGSFLLLCWIYGVFVYCALLNPVVAGRYLLPLVPAVAIVFGKRFGPNGGWKRPAFISGSVFLVVISLLVTSADYRYANAVRSAAGNVLNVWAREGNKLFFQGHWGFQYYLEEGGAIALSHAEPQARVGDLIASPSFGSNVSELNPAYLAAAGWFSILPVKWFSTFNNGIGAGFHCSLYGPLPYAFGDVKPDFFYLQEVSMQR